MGTHSFFIDFDGDGRTDVLVFRSSDGYFAKWYSDAARGPDFVYTAPRYIGGSPGAFPGAQLVVGDFDGDGSTDVLVFRPSDGYVGKWYRDAARGPDFIYQSAVYCGLFYADLRVGDFDGDGIDDVMLFRSGDGTFAKWYSDAARGPDFIRQQLRWIGGNPCVFPNAEILSAAEGSTYRAPHLIQPPPTITGFGPTHGAVGTPVSISGSNFAPNRLWCPGERVEFAGVSATIRAISDIWMRTSVPAGATTGRISIVTAWGTATSDSDFTVDLPAVLVSVPALIGQSLQEAYQLLQQAGLTVGQLYGSTGFNLQVVGQNPSAGTRVAQGSPVDLTLSQVVIGVSQATLFDALPSASVLVYLYDSSTQNWAIQNGGSPLSNGDSVTIVFSAKQFYKVAAVDLSRCNDPTNIDCVEWEQVFLGDPSGPSYSENMTT